MTVRNAVDRSLFAMTRRLLLILAVFALVTLSAAGWMSLSALRQSRDTLRTQTDVGVAISVSRELLARLGTAQAIVQYLTSTDAGPEGQMLRERLAGTNAISGVILEPWHGSGDASGVLTDFNASQRLSLLAGQSLLRAAPRRRPALYIVHRVEVAGVVQIGLFEVDSQWLWQGAILTPPHLYLAVLDAGGHTLFRTVGGPREDYAALIAPAKSADRAQISGGTGQPQLRDWTQGHEAWRGAVQPMTLTPTRLDAAPWTLLVYQRRVGWWPPLGEWAGGLPLIPLVLVCMGAAAVSLRRSWAPALLSLHTALEGLRRGEFRRAELTGGGASPLALVAESYNHAVATLERKTRTLHTLREIDQLLAADQLEQSIDAVLPRIRSVSGADAAILLLVDRDAPGYGRCFICAPEDDEARGSPGEAGREGVCAMKRVSVDDELARRLAESPDGLVLSSAESCRYPGLDALCERNLPQQRAWPVTAAKELDAIVALGYREGNEAMRELADYGAECAARLAVALSNRARDERLYRQAHFDSLTSLPNRLLFRDRLSQELASAAGGTQHGALLYIDLDYFKRINDSVGHDAGDQFLTIVAQRLRACVKEGDTVARLGGDEFGVILRHARSADNATEVAERIIESLQRPVRLAGRDHHVCASIGITLFPDDARTLEDLLRNADMAMYRAKDGGRSRAMFFDRSMTRPPLAAAESGLYRALRRQEFMLYYQPQYALATGELVGLEGLLRWRTQREGLRFPNDFVPMAEDIGVIAEIGAWTLDNACAQFAQWRAQGIAPARISLNVSVHQLRASDYGQLVRRALERFELPPEVLELEITETVLAQEQARLALLGLEELGVRLSLDDFGTGYSSLNDLRRHPVHAIKIDRSFLNGVPENQQASTLAESMIQMAHALGKQVVAEGVESMAQLEFLREHGCEFAQGFALARPGTIEQVTELLAAARRAPELMQQSTVG